MDEPQMLAKATIRFVSRYLDIPPGELIGEGRAFELARGRWIIARVLRNCGWSTPRIGRVLGKRDHSTVLHMLKRYHDVSKKDAEIVLIFSAVWNDLMKLGVLHDLPVSVALHLPDKYSHNSHLSDDYRIN